MIVTSVNVGKKVEKPWRDGTITAIHKSTHDDKLLVSESGLHGDEQADLKHHGGRDKAILVLPTSAYQRFEVSQPYGYLGENLSIEGVDEAEVCLGDRLQIGSTLLEVSQPRSPCWKLDAQAIADTGNKQGSFLKAYSESGRVGFYCRVLVSGMIKAGQKVIWLTRAESETKQVPRVSIQSLFLAKQYRKGEAAWKTMEQAVKHPALSQAWQDELKLILERRNQ